MGRIRWRLGATVFAIGWIAVGFSGTARAWQQSELNEPEGAQVLTQGPIHEAFAEPVLQPEARPGRPQGLAGADRRAPARPEARGGQRPVDSRLLGLGRRAE